MKGCGCLLLALIGAVLLVKFSFITHLLCSHRGHCAVASFQSAVRICWCVYEMRDRAPAFFIRRKRGYGYFLSIPCDGFHGSEGERLVI